MKQLINFTYDELTPGQTASYSKTVTSKDITLFAAVSGDVNPLHLDEEYAAKTRFGGRIAHGAMTNAVISAALAMVLPGPGVIYLGQVIRYVQPVMAGDRITVTLEVTHKRDDKRIVRLACEVTNQDSEVVAEGEAQVIAADKKIVIERPALPRFKALD